VADASAAVFVVISAALGFADAACGSGRGTVRPGISGDAATRALDPEALVFEVLNQASLSALSISRCQVACRVSASPRCASEPLGPAEALIAGIPRASICGLIGRMP
jgi:hypothetical protein